MSSKFELSEIQLNVLADCVGRLIKLARKAKSAADFASLAGSDSSAALPELSEVDLPDDSSTPESAQARK